MIPWKGGYIRFYGSEKQQIELPKTLKSGLSVPAYFML